MKIDEGSKDTIKTALLWIGCVMLPAAAWYWISGEPILNWFINRPEIFSLLIFFFWGVYEGKREAYYFSLKMVTQKFDKLNEHGMFATQRLQVFILFAIINGVVPMFLTMLMFPFIHDGTYYLFRHKLDKCYPKKFFDFNNSSALINFDIITRISLFIIGISLYFYLWLANISLF